MAKGRRKKSTSGAGKGETGRYVVEAKGGGRAVAIDKRTGEYREKCRIITFKRPKRVTTVRCEGADAKAVWRAAARERKQCRGKKMRFARCR